ncbi:MAG: heme ABC exporter ATP-binding protein CcmA [Candidatus Puniceispirillum sp.]|jgi:heme exporter protein A
MQVIERIPSSKTPPSGGKPVSLRIHKLCVFRGATLVLNRLCHQQGAGELCCVVGANGAGKSTLLRTLAGRLHPAEGTITCLPPKLYVGHADGLSPTLTGRENLKFWGQVFGLASNTHRLDTALSHFDAAGFADMPVRLLSRGQRRRLALSRLLLGPAKALWLLDEPNAGLDQASRDQLDNAVISHIATGGMVLAATHLPLADTALQSRLILGGGQM